MSTKPFKPKLYFELQNGLQRETARWLRSEKDAEKKSMEMHRVANGYNWDSGIELLEWIVFQEECDKATALLIFWRSAPERVIQCKTKKAANANFVGDEWPVLRNIVGLWNAGKFTRSVFSYAETHQIGLDKWRALEAEIAPDDLPFRTPDEMHEPISGEIVETPETYVEGWPPHLWERFTA